MWLALAEAWGAKAKMGEKDGTEAAGAASGPAGSEGERLAASLAHLLL